VPLAGTWVSYRPCSGEVGPHCGVFLGGTFTSRTSINSLVQIIIGHQSEAKLKLRGSKRGLSERKIRDHAREETERQERAELFDKLAAYELAPCLPSLWEFW